MNPTEIGRKAENVAAKFLITKGCDVVARNWRTRWCEVDIVARRDRIVYFCEVKYRRSARQGWGAEYVTPQKLRQMSFAAEMWCAKHNWQNDYQLCVIEISGGDFRITGVYRDII